jgi:hypothetical protein
MPKIQTTQTNANGFKHWNLHLGFVSDFDIRISSFLGGGYRKAC